MFITKKSFIKGIKDGMPILLGYLSVSFAYGILVASSLPWFVPIIISATNLTGTGQFVGTQLLIAGAAVAEIGLTVFIINIRYILMSISLSQKMSKSLPLRKRLLLAFGNTDEVYAVAMRENTISGSYLFGVIVAAYVGWVSGTALGAILGDVIPPDLKSAMGVALFAMYIAIIFPPVSSDGYAFLIIAAAAVISCVIKFVPVFAALPTGYSITISGVLSTLVFSVVKVKRQKKHGKDKMIVLKPLYGIGRDKL